MIAARTVVLVAIAACSNKSSEPPAAKPRDAAVIAIDGSVDAVPIDAGPALDVILEASPVELRMKQRDKFKLAIKVTNRSAATVDPKLDDSQLLVNGEPDLLWTNTLINSGRGRTWTELRAGETATGSWSLGDGLFLAPGDYTLQLRVSDILSPPVQIHVTK
jgi:hypothetical protein